MSEHYRYVVSAEEIDVIFVLKDDPTADFMVSFSDIIAGKRPWIWNELVGADVHLLEAGQACLVQSKCGQLLCSELGSRFDIICKENDLFARYIVDVQGRRLVLYSPGTVASHASSFIAILDESLNAGDLSGKVWFGIPQDRELYYGCSMDFLEDEGYVFGTQAMFVVSKVLALRLTDVIYGMVSDRVQGRSPEELLRLRDEFAREKKSPNSAELRVVNPELSVAEKNFLKGTLSEVTVDMRVLKYGLGEKFSPNDCYKLVQQAAEQHGRHPLDLDFVCSRCMTVFADHLIKIGLPCEWVRARSGHGYELLFTHADIAVDLFSWFQLLIETADNDERKLAVNMGYALKFPGSPEVPLPQGYVPSQVR